jgi:hypothetical protein
MIDRKPSIAELPERHARLQGRCLGVALLAFAALALALLTPVPARAQNSAAAEALFTEGRRLMQAGDYERACPKLAESQRLDPGAGTALNLAECYERLGKTATAWATWLEAASMAKQAGQDAREDHARKRASALEPKLVRMVIVVPPENRVPGLEIVRNGVLVNEAFWDMPVPVDPGRYTITARAPHRLEFTTEVNVVEGAPAPTITIPLLVSAGASAPPGWTGYAQPGPAPGQPYGQTPPQQERSTPGSGQRVVGGILAGVGLVGLVVGTVFALDAKETYKDSKQYCMPYDVNLCSEQGVALRNDAIDAGNTASVAFIAGGVLFGVGGIVYLTAPSAPSSSATELRAGAGFDGSTARLAVSGTF